jgi:ribosomal protein L7/L12
VLDAVRVRIVSSDVKADISTSPLESVFEYGMSLVEYGRALVAPKDTPFNVVLTGCDGKIAAIKAIREAMGYGLKEAKDMVEGIPSVFAARVSKDQAWNIKNILVRGGCLVSIRESK